MDPLQKLHTLTNLARLLEKAAEARAAGEGAAGAAAAEAAAAGSDPQQGQPQGPQQGQPTQAPAAREQLLQQAELLSGAYLAPFAAKLAAAQGDFDRARQAADPAQLRGAERWFLPALDALARAQGREWEAFFARLADQMNEQWQGQPFPFRDARGLQYTLSRDMEEIARQRKAMLEVVQRLSRVCANPSARDVETAGHCFQCKPEMGTPGIVCAHCSEADPVLDRFELCLFGRQFQQALPGRHVKQADVGTGRTNPSSAETALRALAGLVGRGADGDDADARQAAKAHLDVLEATRREFSRARALLVAQRQALAARDELDMANSSFRLRAGPEIPPPGAPRVPGVRASPALSAPSAHSTLH